MDEIGPVDYAIIAFTGSNFPAGPSPGSRSSWTPERTLVSEGRAAVAAVVQIRACPPR